MTEMKDDGIRMKNRGDNANTSREDNGNDDSLDRRRRRSLRVCCYGSSSPRTPLKFLEEAYVLGYELAKRGHICVNGGGRYGCMGAMNDGVVAAGCGKLVGVIHESFTVDGKDCHAAFLQERSSDDDDVSLQVVGGTDLQERKRLLVQNADAIIVLPGGPGTWDELWEIACVKQLQLSSSSPLPIVCVNIDQFYQPFQQMLHSAHSHQLLKTQQSPSSILHFEPTSIQAIQYIEQQLIPHHHHHYTTSHINLQNPTITTTITRRLSFSSISSLLSQNWNNIRSTLFTTTTHGNSYKPKQHPSHHPSHRHDHLQYCSKLICIFVAGAFFGKAISSKQG